MFQVALTLLMVVSGGEKQPLKYEDAFAKAQKENKPLMVLVGAKWCSSCQVMKRETIQPMKKEGELKDVVVAFVDKDERPELAGQLMKGETLPQLVVFSKRTGSWRRFSLVGMQSQRRMHELLSRVRGVVRKTIR